MINYDINEVIKLKEEEKLSWKEIGEKIGKSPDTLRHRYYQEKSGLTHAEANPNNYKNQKLRGLKRKYDAIITRGGKCECCGYNKNIAALDFHHLNPEEKSFQLDIRHFSNTKLETLEKELSKCILLCANCHREVHNPDYEISNIEILIKDCDKTSFNNKKETSICPYCGKEFYSKKGKIYCCKECREADKHYPSKQEVLEQYKLLGTWDKVAEHFGLTRKIIQGIRKKDS